MLDKKVTVSVWGVGVDGCLCGCRGVSVDGGGWGERVCGVCVCVYGCGWVWAWVGVAITNVIIHSHYPKSVQVLIPTYVYIHSTPHPEGTVWSCSPGSTTSQRQGESKQTRFQQTSSLYVNLSEV